MAIGSISFGSVIAVSGKTRKISGLNNKLSQYERAGKVIIRDVTDRYRYSPATGLMAKAAQKGDNVAVYITGDDVENIKSKMFKGQREMDVVLSSMTSYYDINKVSAHKVVKAVLNK